MVWKERRYDMRHELLTQRALTPIQKKGMLSQQFVMHVAPPLVWKYIERVVVVVVVGGGGGGGGHLLYESLQGKPAWSG